MIKIVYSLTCVLFHIYTEKDDLGEKYIPELLQLCREYKAQKTDPKFPNFSKANRGELIQMIRNHRIALAGDPVENLNAKMVALGVEPTAVEKEAKLKEKANCTGVFPYIIKAKEEAGAKKEEAGAKEGAKKRAELKKKVTKISALDVYKSIPGIIIDGDIIDDDSEDEEREKYVVRGYVGDGYGKFEETFNDINEARACYENIKKEGRYSSIELDDITNEDEPEMIEHEQFSDPEEDDSEEEEAGVGGE